MSSGKRRKKTLKPQSKHTKHKLDTEKVEGLKDDESLLKQGIYMIS